MKKLILLAAVAATSMAQAVTMATKNYVDNKDTALHTTITSEQKTIREEDAFYKNSMWYLGNGTEGATVLLKDHTITYVTLATAGSRTTVQIPAPIVVNGVNRARAMFFTVQCTVTTGTMPQIIWPTKDIAGNTITYYGRDGNETAQPAKGTKIMTISEVKPNSFMIDYAEMEEINK